MDPQTRRALIRIYAETPAIVRGLVHELDEPTLDHRNDPNGWSPRMVIHHLADSEMTSAIRLRRLLAEDSPTIEGYDEELFARTLRYDRPIEPSLLAFEAARASTVPLLERLEEDDWARGGTHTESGPYSVETWLDIYARHGTDHAEQIRAQLPR